MHFTTTTIISALSLTSLASARFINKARQTVNQAFELDIQTDNIPGVQDLYSRTDGYIWARINADDNIASAAVRSVKNDVTCTLKDVRGYPIRSFGGIGGKQEYKREAWENDHVDSIGCFFPGESEADYPQIPGPSVVPRQVGRPFEMDLVYAGAGVKDFYSREDGFIRADVIEGDKLTTAAVRSIEGDVVCTIKDVDGYQVRKFGGEHPQQIELSEYESLKAKTVGCYFPGQEPSK